ncbi:MAG TPA: CoB--CoM heterodisulfide reductase iron-sulfur subunit A family protein [bacterium (Candidatus Stahlbacteria)]|nr:CoB--CoM heterodisulfide reductase iron-sulfur subunit A family protein [Candidatus Stahlbacteria bacterium]
MGDELRIGVFVCECGQNIAGTVNCDELREYAESLPDVVCAVKNRYTCAEPGQQEIKKYVVEEKLNRVVVAACTPKMHEPTFRQCVSDVGLNPYLFEMVNIREHCSWVHSYDKARATEKAKELVKAGVARARLLEPQIELEVPVTQAALVIGGGIAGIQAALDLANAGYPVWLVEKEPSIGGIMAQLNKTYPTMD